MAGKASGKAVFVCQQCGHQEPRWHGRCPACGLWNSFVEEVVRKGPRGEAVAESHAAVPLASLAVGGSVERLGSRVSELDRVLGGGVVPGSAVLLGGDPGIGKSTLALQLAAGVAAGGARVLYVCGEEAPAQVRLRAERLGIATAGIAVLAATDVAAIEPVARAERTTVCIVDSVQTIYTREVESAPGSVSQLREATARLIALARQLDMALLLIGHVTKEGALAGPRVLEHMVDTVLYFEGEGRSTFRILRAVKNRYGPANEIGIFEMRGDGLAVVADPSQVLAVSRRTDATGSVVSAAIEGSRPVLVEIQALVAPSNPGSARRTTLGVDHGRVAMLAAVMEKHMGLSIVQDDIFVNTAGGIRVDDPGVDLAVVAALASSFLGRAVSRDTIVLGEVGLTGEVRLVGQASARVREAARLGFRRAVLPAASVAQVEQSLGGSSLTLIGVEAVGGAWESICP